MSAAILFGSMAVMIGFGIPIAIVLGVSSALTLLYSCLLYTSVFSLEMSKEQLVNRMLSMESNVDSQKLRTGTLTDADWDAVVEGIGVIGNSKLIIDDTPGISITELRSKCRKMKLEFGLNLVIIDYLQLMSGSGRCV